MKVKELIKQLKKQPMDCDVGVSMHDNNYNEVVGLVHTVYFLDKEDIVKEESRYIPPEIHVKFPNFDCVVLGC